MSDVEEGTARTEEATSPESEARRLYLLTTVRQYPDPVLRMKAREVTRFDGALKELVERMTTVMEQGNGVGLAAPQVGVLQRVLVHRADEEVGPVALVNPRIVTVGEELETAEEGCLSLGAAQVVVEIERATRVEVEAQTPGGEPVAFAAEGFEARVLQHEIDHLDGILIIDRASPEQRKAALAKLRPQPTLARVG
jgi:peptide deformylase